MPTFLHAQRIAEATQRLIDSRATIGFVNFLIFKRALVLSNTGDVVFSLRDRPFMQAISELASTDPNASGTVQCKPFVVVFGSSGDKDKYRGEKFPTNGPADTLSGPGWKRVILTKGQDPRHARLRAPYLSHLPEVVLKSGAILPDIADAAIWFHRASDLSSIVEPAKLMRANLDALVAAFKSALKLTNDEESILFSRNPGDPTGTFPDWFGDTPADPSLYLPHPTAAGTLAASSTVPGENIIYFGPPGTGKSHTAEEVAGGDPDQIRVLFHPEYTYNDFFGAYRPVVGSDSSSQIEAYNGGRRAKPVCYFEFVPGPLLESLKQAFNVPTKHIHFIIDEINRGDCAAIFGDVLQLLDRSPNGASKYGISVRQEARAWLDANCPAWRTRGGKLYFPANFTILATMNTSDQSLYPMDSAFKRRWQWRSCNLESTAVLAFLGGKRPALQDAKKKWDWITVLDRINSQILRDHLEDKQIGPWFIAPVRETGLIDSNSFGNKCLYYLWHDVFKDAQVSETSPFKDGIRSFQELQSKFADGGLQAIFKDELLRGTEFGRPSVETEAQAASQAPEQTAAAPGAA